MVVVLSLCAALAYGLSDFVGGLASRRVSPWAVAFVVQVTAHGLIRREARPPTKSESP